MSRTQHKYQVAFALCTVLVSSLLVLPRAYAETDPLTQLLQGTSTSTPTTTTDTTTNPDAASTDTNLDAAPIETATNDTASATEPTVTTQENTVPDISEAKAAAPTEPAPKQLTKSGPAETLLLALGAVLLATVYTISRKKSFQN